MKVAVVGANISGLLSAYELAKSGVKVVVYEKECYQGGHAKTININGVDLDLGFMVFNDVTYPNLMEFFEFLGVDMEISDMSFSVSLDQGSGCEWGTRNGFSSLFAQKKNVLNPYFWQMIREIIRFKQDVISYLEELDNNPDIDCNETLGQFIGSHGYSEQFQKSYLNLGESKLPYLVTVDPPHTPEHTLVKWRTRHLVPSVAASKASCELHQIQGKRGIWFCGAYHGYGFNVNGLKAGVVAADGMLRRNRSILYNPKHLVPTWPETGAHLLVTRFFKSYIQTGCMILLEGGTIFTFQGTDRKCSLKVSLTVHNMQFYWKVATQADLGLADAFIHGNFSFVDKNEGLLNLFMIFIANRDLKASVRTSSKKRGWWTPLLFTAALSSAKYFIRHVSNRNTLTQARRNISLHYNLSNELFSLFLDETMTYSCAVFKSEDEDLKVAQLRKISLLIEKDQITFLLCDYRQIPNKDKYDRIISCEMLEAVGHEFMEEFFTCCESALAEDGLLVLQFISTPDVRYSEYIQNSDFIKEYIFPGACVPALSRITSAMAAASRLCVVHLEDIGIHYYQTLRYWRKNFLNNKSQIRALGFDDKFVRTWEYYFDYCAAGFKTCTLGDYQIVFSRPGNVAAFGDPYNVVPSTY
ncbi:hypothetical protein MTR67_019445 [Solanum verrucosum]|nr:hypothetical protein MTR67_019445 [Solanum verrucosum]